MKKITFIFVALLTLASCASNKKQELPEYEEKSVVELYDKAKKLLDEEKYLSASKAFDEVERQHPYSEWAIKAQLMSAYAFYQNMNYDDALLAIDRYIALHPADKSVSYAYYLRSLCYYEQISDVKRDQSVTQLAMYSLEDVVKKFPNSDYAKDAKLKIDLTKSNLAGQHMSIGRYYLNKELYNAAINRFNVVVDEYQETEHIEEALYRLVECYMSLGVVTEAERVASILGYNYSSGKWYERAYELLENK